MSVLIVAERSFPDMAGKFSSRDILLFKMIIAMIINELISNCTLLQEQDTRHLYN